MRPEDQGLVGSRLFDALSERGGSVGWRRLPRSDSQPGISAGSRLHSAGALDNIRSRALKGVAGFPLQDLGWSGRHPNDANTGNSVTHKSVPSSAGGHGVGQQPMSPVGCLVQFAPGFGAFARIVLIRVTILRGPRWTFTFKDALS